MRRGHDRFLLVRTWCCLTVLLPASAVLAADDWASRASQAVSRAVEFLASAQQPDGSFLVTRCSDAAMTRCSPDQSPAKEWILGSPPTATVLMGLSRIPDPRAAAIVGKGGRFLRSQMDDQGLFGSYRFRSAATGAQCPGEFRQLELTCLQRTALEQAGYPLPPLLSALMAYQSSTGLFYPFAIPPSEVERIAVDSVARNRFAQQHPLLMRDYSPMMLELMGLVDPIVNAEILAYAARYGKQPAAVCAYLAEVARGELAPGYSRYMDSPYYFIQVLSRAYADGARCLEPARQGLEARLLEEQRPDGSWGDAMDTALAASSLMHFGYEGRALDRAVGALLSQQQPDGSWPRALWRLLRGHPFWFGSTEVTTGIALEAMDCYLRQRGPVHSRVARSDGAGVQERSAR